MRCDHCREGLSARLDHEALPPGLDDGEIDAHLATCGGCATWAVAATRLHRTARIRPAQPTADRTDAILAGVPVTARPQPVRDGVRYALVAIGLTQLLLAIPALLLAEDAAAPVHVAREMGAFELALAVGLLSAAWRPRLAPGLLPFAGALAGATVLATVVDVAQGTAVAFTEAHHILDLAGVALLWLLPTRPGQALRGRALPAAT